ncbi:MAG: hypothetical protein U1F66_11750 [bacterium]
MTDTEFLWNWRGKGCRIAVTCYLILDLEYPRLGFMKAESYDEALRRVLEGMR